ncbi:MAG: hypothetical protein B6I22_01550 [Desulfobacteraceae bacterium 4572_123]|nr:MAG: hypothetical protein B6I22_01550 [Desulfobacteraceae bacterium 4572_123]
MKTYYECIPCLLRQTVDAVRFASDDPKIHEAVLREVLKLAADMDLRQTPPMMARNIHRTIRRYSGNDDPYLQVKQDFNRMALNLYPDLKKRVTQSPDPVSTAVRLAIAGNMIDFGARRDMDQDFVLAGIQNALTCDLVGDIQAFKNAVNRADRILYLGDNTGEIVFDRLLIETLPSDKIIFAVRGYPVLNDATIEDTKEVGLFNIVKVIDNGSDAPGTILEDCSPEFAEHFNAADFVIAKGQGNYETLSDADKRIFFLLQAKCPVIAADIGCEVGRLIVKTNAER